MPLPMRKVEPVHVGRGNLPDKYKIQNDLEAHANGTLANIILQLSSLSHHAEEIFSDLVHTATDVTTRSAKLQSRIDRLTEKVHVLDRVHDEHSLYDCANTKPFQSSASFDQQVVCRACITPGMLKTLNSCDRPPPLEKLNPYRDDGKDGLKFYTDPNYFFELWRQEMISATEKAVRKPLKTKKDGGQRNKKHIRQLVSTREKQRNRALKQGEVIMSPSSTLAPGDESQHLECDDGVVYLPQVTKKSSRPTSVEIKHVSFEGIDDTKTSITTGDYSLSSNVGTPNGRASRSCIRETLPPPPPPPAEDASSAAHSTYPPPPQETIGQLKVYTGPAAIGGSEETETDDELPPPPPTPDQYHVDHSMELPHPPPLPRSGNDNGDDGTLPPSPPPPPGGGPPAPPPPPLAQAEDVGSTLITVNNCKTKSKVYIPAAVDGRTQLMEAIRGGTFRLRKVDEKKDSGKEKPPAAMDSVAEILARRKAFEMSDSDSSESSAEYDSDGWDETSA